MAPKDNGTASKNPWFQMRYLDDRFGNEESTCCYQKPYLSSMMIPACCERSSVCLRRPDSMLRPSQTRKSFLRARTRAMPDVLCWTLTWAACLGLNCGVKSTFRESPFRQF